jgi:hypothetical protein
MITIHLVLPCRKYGPRTQLIGHIRHPNYGHLEIFLLKFDIKSSISIVSSSEAKTCLLIVHVIEEGATVSTEIQRPAHSVQNIAWMMLVLLNLPYLHPNWQPKT